jgi:sugar lactone lactonase YvrE
LCCGIGWAAPAHRAVYFDSTRSSSLVTLTDAKSLADFFVSAGYERLDAPALKTWMDARINDHESSVIVFAQDIAPDTVAEGTANGPSQNATALNYLLAGGKVVWACGENPFVYSAGQDGTLLTWGDKGPNIILGIPTFPAGGQGYGYGTPTDDGKAWGIGTAWFSQRGVDTNVVNVVLSLSNKGGKDFAAGWVLYPTSSNPRTGFVRLYDRAGPPDKFYEVLSAAEYPDKPSFPPLVRGLNVTGASNTQASAVLMGGEGLKDIKAVRFVRDGQSPIEGTELQTSDTAAGANFDFKGRVLGAWDLQVDDANGATFTFPHMITLADQVAFTRRVPRPLILGDVTSDGQVNIGDVVALIRLVVGLVAPIQGQTLKSDLYPLPSDTNPTLGDGKLSVNDALLLLQHVVGLDQQNSFLQQRTVSTVAGTPALSGFQDGSSADALLNFPVQSVRDQLGNLYVTDLANFRIRKVAPDGTVTTYAGDAGQGKQDYADGTLAEAKFAGPYGITIDKTGNLYVSDTAAFRIRKISWDGKVTTLAGTGQSGIANGPGNQATFGQPGQMAAGPDDSLYVIDARAQAIRKITPDGTVSTLAGGTAGYANGKGTQAEFQFTVPSSTNPIIGGGIAVGPDGTVYVADDGNQRIRKITPDGDVTTLAGSGLAGYQDGPAATAKFFFPEGLSMGADGMLYIADANNHRIRRLDPVAGTVTTLSGSGLFGGAYGGFADGSATLARFASPLSVWADSDGSVYVTDSGNNVIRKIAP